MLKIGDRIAVDKYHIANLYCFGRSIEGVGDISNIARNNEAFEVIYIKYLETCMQSILGHGVPYSNRAHLYQNTLAQYILP